MSRLPFRFGYACPCMVQVLPLVETEFLLRGLIVESIDYYQLAYNRGVTASSQTHWGGGVFDTAQHTDEHLHIWRSWGCTVQRRTPEQGFDLHGHGVIKGCPHVSTGRSGAEWQLSEWEAGRNGLRGQGPITGPGPTGKDTPTWQRAIRERGPILTALKDELTAKMLTENDVIRAVLEAFRRDGVVDNIGLTGNPKNPTVAVDTALAHIGRRVTNLEVDLSRIQHSLNQILDRLPKETP